MFSSDIERRVLGHLPPWTADEDAYRQAELDEGAAHSIREYSLGSLTARLLGDSCIPPRSEEQVSAFLAALVEKGYVAAQPSETAGDYPGAECFRMTEAGMEALSEPTLAEHEQTSGPVQIGTGS
jgi:hypothetical protein